jgi:hypothetical protein
LDFLCELYYEHQILNIMYVCIFEWLGHVRMDDERTVKQLLEGKSGGRGGKGGDYN